MAQNGTAGEGPMEIGFHHGDLTVTEVKEGLQANLQDPDDIIAKERSRRPIRQAGAFPLLAADEVLNDGRLLRTKMMMSIGDTHTLSLYVMNHSGANFTDGPKVKVTGKIFGRWQR